MEKRKRKMQQAILEKQKHKIAEYKARKKQTEELLQTAIFDDDITDDEDDIGGGGGAPDILDSYVEELSRGNKR
jgi:hypothetical protein